MKANHQKAIREKLEEWAGLQTKIGKLESARNKKLDPFMRDYNEATKPIQEEFEAKSLPLRERANGIAEEINRLIAADRDAEGNPKPVTIASECATASIERKEANRVIDPQKFFNFVKVKTDRFWQAVTIQIGKAKDVISEKEIDDLSTKKTTYSFSISLKK